MASKPKTLVLGVTGSIAAYKACDVVSALRKSSRLKVHVVMSQGAKEFVSPLTFQTLSGNTVYSNPFERPEEWDLLHTSLAREANLVLIYPATMNIIGKLANGICDDLVTSVAFATKAPVWVAPAMNTQMYENPATQRNLKILKQSGVETIGPIRGELACREVGLGHVIEPAQAVKLVRNKLRV